jgi:hypothetical protein
MGMPTPHQHSFSAGRRFPLELDACHLVEEGLLPTSSQEQVVGCGRRFTPNPTASSPLQDTEVPGSPDRSAISRPGAHQGLMRTWSGSFASCLPRSQIVLVPRINMVMLTE